MKSLIALLEKFSPKGTFTHPENQGYAAGYRDAFDLVRKHLADCSSEPTVLAIPTERMCDGARGFIMGLDLGCRKWAEMEKHLDAGGYDCLPYIRQKAKETPKGHITKWDVADCIWQLMARYHPVPAVETTPQGSQSQGGQL